MQPDLNDEQGAEGPKEDAQEMFADDVLPKVFLDDVLGCRGLMKMIHMVRLMVMR